ncbi:hypothetical protein ELI45_32685 (plasmid) [Rhizobium ruizarguesonis]|nr:hypothetical protein ELI45_32685 [Rhizobium ruizarguesonis]TAV03432.1 hypothetical protein ELI34_30335 [Rhizobium ruizarguesonis]TAV22601.1 hypothetical protein ELI35_31100 [Rhizobium ruizarguesonis]
MTFLSGLSAFPIAPMDRDGKIDAETLRKLIARLAAAKVDSISLLGSTGTYMYLSREECRRALALAVEETGGRIPIVVGVGALRTDEAVRLAQDAKALGATAGLLAAVSYAPLTVDEVFEHFSTVARESKLSICSDRAVLPAIPRYSARDDRLILSGIIFVLRNGLRWRDALREYGPHKTIYNRFIRWSRLGVFNRFLPN